MTTARNIDFEKVLSKLPEPVLIENERHLIVWANEAARELLSIEVGRQSVVPTEVTEEMIKGRKSIVVRKVNIGSRAFECKSCRLNDIYTDADGGGGGVGRKHDRHINDSAAIVSILIDVTSLDRLIQAMTDETQNQPEMVKVSILSILSDVSELEKIAAYWARIAEENERRAGELQRSNAELEMFAYVASHDLQEPLRMVGSYLQLLERRYKDKLDSDAQEFIAYAVDGAGRMKELINDLLTLSRVHTHGKPFESTDCGAVLDRVLGCLKMAIEESGAEVTHDPLPSVVADGSQLGQLLQNLLENAMKFRGEQPPRVHLSARLNEKEWIFSVRDNGIGFDPRYAEQIFGIFQHLHGREEYPGSGIGLAVCKKIAERHGGRIWVESQPGEGSTFYFTLPAIGRG